MCDPFHFVYFLQFLLDLFFSFFWVSHLQKVLMWVLAWLISSSLVCWRIFFITFSYLNDNLNGNGILGSKHFFQCFKTNTWYLFAFSIVVKKCDSLSFAWCALLDSFQNFLFEFGVLKFHSNVCKCWIFLISPFGMLCTLSIWSYLSSLIWGNLSPLILRICPSLYFIFSIPLLLFSGCFYKLYFSFLNLSLYSFWRYIYSHLVFQLTNLFFSCIHLTM